MILPCCDGSTLTWTRAAIDDPGLSVPPGTAVPITITVSPARPGHVVALDYRVDGGVIRRVNALPSPMDAMAQDRSFQVVLPPQPAGLVEFLPVLQAGGLTLSPPLKDSLHPPSSYHVAAPPSPSPVPSPMRLPASANPRANGMPRWAWGGKFLGALTARLSKEVVGPTPEGLRINWHVEEGHFQGPGLRATILPGATDWMRIRQDGIGIVEVTACLQTETGIRIYSSYGGMFDLGPDGFARALRDDFDQLPPLVVTPTYLTAAPALAWLNRLQCIGVGHVHLKNLKLEVDVYQIELGGRLSPA